MIFSIFVLVAALFNQAFAKKEVVIGKNCHWNFFHHPQAIEAIEKICFSVWIFLENSLSAFSLAQSWLSFSSRTREESFIFDHWKHITDELFLFVYQQFTILLKLNFHVLIFIRDLLINFCCVKTIFKINLNLWRIFCIQNVKIFNWMQ